jgi:hypothetical protein
LDVSRASGGLPVGFGNGEYVELLCDIGAIFGVENGSNTRSHLAFQMMFGDVFLSALLAMVILLT